MRILHVISNLEGGGSQRQLAYLAAEQTRAGHEVHVAYTHPGDGCALKHLEESGATLHMLRSQADRASQRFARLATLLNRIAPDMVQTWLLQAHILAGTVCTVNRIPWILREPCSSDAYPQTWKSRLMNLLGRRATAIVSNSLAGDRYWAMHAGQVARFVIRNGVVDDLGKEATADSGDAEFDLSQPAGRVVLYVGRFTEQKNILSMLSALIEVAVGNQDLLFMLCGQGPLHTRAMEIAAASPAVSRIRFLGYRNDIGALMSRAEVFVSVSHFEGTPNSVLEAMNAGCPLLVSDIPEHREFLDEDCAIFVDRYSVAAIAGGIRTVLRDPDTARKRAARARERLAVLSVAAMAGQYEEVYRTVLSARGDPSIHSKQAAKAI